MVNFTAPSLNFSYTQQHLIDFLFQGYFHVFGYFFWPIIFSVVVAYIYVKNTSAVSASVAILILLAGFGGTNALAHVPVVVQLFQLIVALSIAGLVVIFLTRRRGG